MQELFTYTYRENTAGSVISLRPEQIRLAPRPKKPEKPNVIIRLAESIRRYGILEPLSVRLVGDAGGFPAYELVSGAKRLAAARLAGLERIPCLVIAHSDASYAMTTVLEHLRGKKLHFFEQAQAFRRLIDDFSLTQEEIATHLSISQSSVANKLRLLQLTPTEREQITAGELTERHARALLRLKSPELRTEAIRRIREDGLNVAATERLISAFLEPTEPSKPSVSVIISPETPPKGICPRKFALQNLQPLYNSIERTLSIFRKTGAHAECSREESADGVCITIRIPKHG